MPGNAGRPPDSGLPEVVVVGRQAHEHPARLRQALMAPGAVHRVTASAPRILQSSPAVVQTPALAGVPPADSSQDLGRPGRSDQPADTEQHQRTDYQQSHHPDQRRIPPRHSGTAPPGSGRCPRVALLTPYGMSHPFWLEGRFRIRPTGPRPVSADAPAARTGRCVYLGEPPGAEMTDTESAGPQSGRWSGFEAPGGDGRC